MQKRVVFHDPTGKRWIRLRRGMRAGLLLLLLLIFLVGLAALTSPQLPRLGLPEVQHTGGFSEVPSIIRGEAAEKNVPFKLKKAAREMKLVRSESPVARPVKAARVMAKKPLVVGFYVNWDRASMVSLRMNLQHLTHLAPEWLVLHNSKGDLDDESDNTVIAIARQANLPVLAMVTNYRNGWRGDELHQLLNNKAARANLVDNIYSNLVEHHFAGVMLDLEQARAGDRHRLVEFVQEVRDKLRPAGLMMAQAIPTEDRAYDARRLVELNEFIVPMVYDEHYQSGRPGPVASQEWFEKQLDQLEKQAPPEKVVVGFGNYGYDWVMGSRGAAEVAFNDVMAAALANKAGIEWDEDTNNPVLRYNHNGQRHEVWFLDAVTGVNQVLEVADRGFRGVGPYGGSAERTRRFGRPWRARSGRSVIWTPNFCGSWMCSKA